MIAYVLILIWVCIVVGIAGAQSKLPRLTLALAFLPGVLVAGFRGRVVGTDTGSYVNFYESVSNFSDVLRLGNSTFEYGFWILNYIASLYSSDYFALLLLIAVIVVGCYAKAIVDSSVDIRVSAIVFICGGFYTFFFNGARQGIAAAICAIAVRPLLTGRFAVFCSLVVLAALFHKTALLLLPMYPIVRRANNSRLNLLFALFGIFLASSMAELVEISSRFDERYVDYNSAGEGGGLGMIAFSCIVTFFFHSVRRLIILSRADYDILLNLLTLGSIIALVSGVLGINPSGVLRLNLYFSVGLLFIWPIFFANLRNSRLRLLIGHFFLVGYATFYFLTTYRFSDLVPFVLNPAVSFS